MAKILQDGRIQVEKGDTLSGIYGSNWQEISGYTGDPTQLQEGTILPPKPAGSLGGSLETKTLPAGPTDKLAIFRNVLQLVTQKAAQEAKAAGSAALPEGMLKPEQVSGGTFGDILNLVSTQKTQGIKDIFKSTTDLLSDIEDRANKQLETLISTGAIANLDDATLQKLANSTNNDVGYLKEIRNIKRKKEMEEKVSSVEDVNTFADMVLTGQMELSGVPAGTNGKIKAEVGRRLAKVYAHPIGKRIETWKAKKEKFIAEEAGLDTPTISDPGTREDLIRDIKGQLPDYSVDEISSLVYSLVPDQWEYNIKRRWKPTE